MWLLDIILVLILCEYSVFIDAQISEKFFRSDYTYFNATRSFYKIHTIHKTWKDAKKTCAIEGTSLFYPEDKNEADVVREFLKQTQPFNWVFIGASAIMAEGVYETINGVPVSNFYHNWAPGEPNAGHAQDCMVLRREGTLHDENCASKYPFICKKTLSSLQWNLPCNMPYTGYEYNEVLGRCYKFHTNPLSWMDAYATCSAELSYLAVIDGQVEDNFLVNLTAKASKNMVVRDFERVVHLGFHDRSNEGWITIKGVPLSDSGFSQWGVKEPNSYGHDKCGSMSYDGQLSDVACEKRCFFICEHDVDRSINEVFAIANIESILKSKLSKFFTNHRLSIDTYNNLEESTDSI